MVIASMQSTHVAEGWVLSSAAPGAQRAPARFLGQLCCQSWTSPAALKADIFFTASPPNKMSLAGSECTVDYQSQMELRLSNEQLQLSTSL